MEDKKQGIFKEVNIIQDQDYERNGMQYMLYGSELISAFQDRQTFFEDGETKFPSNISLENSTIVIPEQVERLNKGCFTNLPLAIDNVIIDQDTVIERGTNIGREIDPLTLTFSDKIYDVKFDLASGVYETIKKGQLKFRMDGSVISEAGISPKKNNYDKNLEFYIAHQVNLQTMGREE